MVKTIAAVVIIGVLLGVFLSSPLFQIEEIVIEGYDREDLNLDQMLGENIFSLENISQIKNELLKEPYVEEVSLQRDFPDRIILIVEYDRPKAALLIDGDYTIFNKFNYILAEGLPENEFDVPVFKNISYRFQEREIILPAVADEILNNLNILDEELLRLIEQIEFQARNIQMNLKNDCYINLGSREEIVRKFIIIDSLWQQRGDDFGNLQYIDVSAPERPVIKERQNNND